ncbi:GlxA family transcriptional regulator [Roseateles saccharophilus]|uniref:Transcriptional regulator GlxA family with amidase domain n=1 Tax=Roseateles saccharophilus TaxID=304 RepID=A0A4R3UH82_ROSSA|nr:helix-turn-helix domain-containing protein [Roseateles saccharophilus]MDG0835052.1 helix-turn-helix domain-containing protein [Roseateles saccharophilus]TCU88304.1 transcriptional regulator GlxA family with amidase domain [Roseateles saccharophilus]
MPEARQAKQVVFVLQDDSLVLDWAGPAEALRLASQEIAALGLGVAPFALRFVAAGAESTGSVGVQLQALEPLPAALPEGSWVVLVGRTSAAEARTPAARSELLAWLARLAPGRTGLRLVTVCSGALLAARAGLLDGRRVTTHHQHLDQLARLAPKATVLQDRVFVQDGEVFTSAGVTAGIDLALHLIALHAGELVAARVAEQMAVALRRGPADPELSPLLAHRQHLNARLHRVQDALSRAPAEDWPLERMAELAATTPRTLSRLFAQHAGTSPQAWLRSVRLAVARHNLQAGASVAAASEAAGFNSELQLRRAWAAAGWAGTPSSARR